MNGLKAGSSLTVRILTYNKCWKGLYYGIEIKVIRLEYLLFMHCYASLSNESLLCDVICFRNKSSRFTVH